MIVCKFGGSSVADAAQIAKIKNIVKSDPERKIVIVSAPGKQNKEDEKITDLLYSCRSLANHDKPIEAVWEKIKKRYMEIALVLGIASDIEEELNKIKKRILEKCSADYAASRGEYLNAKLISLYFGFEFLDSADVIRIGGDGGILQKTYELIKAEIDPSKKYLIPGFYGRGTDGEIKTFSRGGSDITGSVFAGALGADLYENWTDVSGIFTCDPRIAENAKPVPEITYREIRELAYFGANVFHEEAVAPVKKAKIAINIKNTNMPEDAGTLILPEREASEHPVAGIAGKRSFRKISIEKYKLENMHDLCSDLKKELKKEGLIIIFELNGVDTLNFYVQDENMIDWQALGSRLKNRLGIEKVIYSTGLSVIGIVGEGIARSSAPLLEILSAAGKAGINIENINYGGSPVSAVIVVSDDDYEKTLNIISGLIP